MEFNQQFKDLIKKNLPQIIAIEKAKITDSSMLKKLKIQYLDDFYNQRPNKNEKFILFFSNNDLANLKFDSIKNNLDGSVSRALHRSNLIKLDSSFNVIKKQYIYFKDQQEVFSKIRKISEKGNLVFFFGETGIDFSVNGFIIEKVNIFYTEQDQQKFQEKYHMSSICVFR